MSAFPLLHAACFICSCLGHGLYIAFVDVLCFWQLKIVRILLNTGFFEPSLLENKRICDWQERVTSTLQPFCCGCW